MSQKSYAWSLLQIMILNRLIIAFSQRNPFPFSGFWEFPWFSHIRLIVNRFLLLHIWIVISVIKMILFTFIIRVGISIWRDDPTGMAYSSGLERNLRNVIRANYVLMRSFSFILKQKVWVMIHMTFSLICTQVILVFLSRIKDIHNRAFIPF